MIFTYSKSDIIQQENIIRIDRYNIEIIDEQI